MHLYHLFPSLCANIAYFSIVDYLFCQRQMRSLPSAFWACDHDTHSRIFKTWFLYLSQSLDKGSCNFQVSLDFLTRDHSLMGSDILVNIWMTCKSGPWMRISTQLSNEADTLILRSFSSAYASYIKEKNIHKHPSSFYFTLIWNAKTQLFRLNSLLRSYLLLCFMAADLI